MRLRIYKKNTIFGKGLFCVSLALCSIVCSMAFGCSKGNNSGSYSSGVNGEDGYEPPASSTTTPSLSVNENAPALVASYTYGDVLEVPGEKISYNGKEYEADARTFLYYPDGTVKDGNVFELSQVGAYRLLYQAEVDEQIITKEKTFIVNKVPYTVPSDSSVKFIETLQTQNPEHDIAKTGGLSVSLGMGSTFTYEQVVDVSNSTKDDALITFTPYQSSHYLSNSGWITPEVEQIIVRITDALNPNNYFDVSFYDGEIYRPKDSTKAFFYPFMQLSAAPYGQTFIGLENSSEHNYNWDNSKHMSDGRFDFLKTVDGIEYAAMGYGRGTMFGNVPVGAEYFENADTTQSLVPFENGTGGYYTLSYDSAEKAVYVTAPSAVGQRVNVTRKLVSLLGADELYDDTFSGFTTGEVYISIFANNYYKDQLHFEISEIGGKTGDELKAENNLVEDKKAPRLEFDTNIPDVIFVEKGKEISILPVTVYDCNYTGKINVSVWKDYGASTAQFVNIVNGSFVPTTVGNYTVVYEAEDAYGNQTIATVLYNSVEDDIIQFAVETPQGTIDAGEILSVENGSASSRNGDVTIEISLLMPNGESVAVHDNEIIVEYAGEYTLTYHYTDGFIAGEKSYKFHGNPSDNVRIEEPVLPLYLIKNAAYTFDTVYATIYNADTPQTLPVVVLASVNGGEYTEIDYTAYRVPTTADNVKFKYTYDEVSIESDVLPVIDVGLTLQNQNKIKNEVNKSAYFVGDVKVEEGSTDVIFTTTKTGVAEFDFINVLSFSTFSFAFTVLDTNGISKVDIILTDYYDRDKTFTISYEDLSTMTSFGFNGNVDTLKEPFHGTSFSVSYLSSVNQISERNGIEKFYASDFLSDKVLLKVRLYDAVQDQSQIMISAVGNEKINKNTRDSTSSTIYADSPYAGLNEINSTVVICAASAVDVLTPFVGGNLNVTVTLPTGSSTIGYAQAEDGTILNGVPCDKEYSFKLSYYGSYLVIYSYTDQMGNSVTLNYNIVCKDNQKPTIELENGYKQSTLVNVKVGDVVELAKYTVTDNVTESAELVVLTYLKKANGELLQLTESSFVAEEAGNYQIYYYCYDADFNYSIVYYNVKAI